MCTASAFDLEEIPLDDDDPNSIEFKILEFYAKHHIFKNMSAVFSPKLLRTRSLSHKGLGTWSANESQTQVSWPCRNSRSSEKPINLAKKKSSWRTLFGVIEKEESSQSSSAEWQDQGPRTLEPQGLHNQGPRSQRGSRSLSNVDQRVELEGRPWGFSPTGRPPRPVCTVVHLPVVVGHSLCLCPQGRNSH